MASPNEELNKANQTSKEFASNLAEIQDTVSNIAESIKQGLNEAIEKAAGLDDVGKKVTKSFGADLVGGLKKIVSSLDTQVELQDQLNKGADISKAIAKERQKMSSLEATIRQRIAILAQNDVDLGKELELELQEQLSTQRKILKTLEDQNNEQNKNLGVTGKLASGLNGILKSIDKSGSLSSILDIDGATQKTKRFANVMGARTGSPVSSIKQAGYFAKQLGTNLMAGVKGIDPITIAVQQLVKGFLSLDELTGKTAKSFNMSAEDARKLNGRLNTIANRSGDAALNTKAMQETLVAVGDSLGSNAQLNEQDLKTFTKLREQAGFTNDELMGIEKLSLATGESLEDNTASIMGSAKAYAAQNKLVINEKQILKDVSKASASLKLSLGGSADALAKSAVQARQFGISLEKAENISKSLLNFEDSISAELEAELLTGKELNLEQARLLALNGDAAGAAAEIAKQVGSSADFAKMNVVQQEAIAKAAGMTREELASSLIEREALEKLGAKEGESQKQAFDRLVKEVGLEEAKKRLGDEQLATQFQQQSVQEKFQQALTKIQDIFVALAEPVLAIVQPLMDIVSALLPAVNALLTPFMQILKVAGNIVGLALKPMVFILTEIGETISNLVAKPMEFVEDIINNVVEIFTGGDLITGFKKIGESIVRMLVYPFQAIMDLVVSLINGAIDVANKLPLVNISHVKSPDIAGEILTAFADGGIVTEPVAGLVGEAGPEAIIPLDEFKEGGMFPGFPQKEPYGLKNLSNLFGDNNNANNDMLVKELQNIKGVLTQILNKSGTVNLDGTKVGTAMAMSTYKTQ